MWSVDRRSDMLLQVKKKNKYQPGTTFGFLRGIISICYFYLRPPSFCVRLRVQESYVIPVPSCHSLHWASLPFIVKYFFFLGYSFLGKLSFLQLMSSTYPMVNAHSRSNSSSEPLWHLRSSRLLWHECAHQKWQFADTLP